MQSGERSGKEQPEADTADAGADKLRTLISVQNKGENSVSIRIPWGLNRLRTNSMVQVKLAKKSLSG
jgi:hypothetical protein